MGRRGLQMAEYTTAVPEEAHGDIPVGLVVPARLACYVKQAPSAVRLTRRRSSERHGSDRTSQPVDVRLAVADMAAGFLSNSAVGEIGCMIGLWTTTSTAVPAGAVRVRLVLVPAACAKAPAGGRGAVQRRRRRQSVIGHGRLLRFGLSNWAFRI